MDTISNPKPNLAMYLNCSNPTSTNITATTITAAYVDKGYRGHGYTRGFEVHIAKQHKKNKLRDERKRRRRRSAIEPKIGYLKSDHRMGRCFLAKLAGNVINAVLAAARPNLRKLLELLRRKVGRFVFALCDGVVQLVFLLIQGRRNLIAWHGNGINASPDRLVFHQAVA